MLFLKSFPRGFTFSAQGVEHSLCGTMNPKSAGFHLFVTLKYLPTGRWWGISTDEPSSKWFPLCSGAPSHVRGHAKRAEVVHWSVGVWEAGVQVSRRVTGAQSEGMHKKSTGGDHLPGLRVLEQLEIFRPLNSMAMRSRETCTGSYRLRFTPGNSEGGRVCTCLTRRRGRQGMTFSPVLPRMPYECPPSPQTGPSRLLLARVV